MVIVVLDTNVIISGTFWAGASSKIIRLVETGKIKLILSAAIVAEYEEILDSDEIREKVGHHEERMRAIHKVLQLGTLIETTEHIYVIQDDPDDDKFIEAAVAGNAQFIISQDKHLLNLKAYKNIKVIEPEEFLTIIGEK